MGCCTNKNSKVMPIVNPLDAQKQVETLNRSQMINSEQLNEILNKLAVLQSDNKDKEQQIIELQQIIYELEEDNIRIEAQLQQALKIINNFKKNMNKTTTQKSQTAFQANKYQFTISEEEFKQLEDDIEKINQQDYSKQKIYDYKIIGHKNTSLMKKRQDNRLSNQNQTQELSKESNQHQDKLYIQFNGDFLKQSSQGLGEYYQHDCQNKKKTIFLTRQGQFVCEGCCQQFSIIDAYVYSFQKIISSSKIAGADFANKIDDHEKLRAIVKQSTQYQNIDQKYESDIFLSEPANQLLENEKPSFQIKNKRKIPDKI